MTVEAKKSYWKCRSMFQAQESKAGGRFVVAGLRISLDTREATIECFNGRPFTQREGG